MIGKPFKKGQSGNPSGRAPLPAELRELRKENRSLLINLVSECMKLSPEPRDPALEFASNTHKLIYETVKRAIAGNMDSLNFIMDIWCAKIPDDDEDDITDEERRIVKRIREIKAEEDAKRALEPSGQANSASSEGRQPPPDSL